MKLEGKVAIVTGGSQGIGQGIVRCLAEEGANIVIADIDIAKANKTAQEVRAMGRQALVVEADVTRREKVEQVVKSALDTFGKIDILVNNVGGQPEITPQNADAATTPQMMAVTMPDLPDELWDGVYQLNLKSQVLMCKAVVPLMKAQKSGKIINIASIAGKSLNAGVGGGGAGGTGSSLMPYGSQKAAVIAFTRQLAREVGPDNINVNSICPGFLYTPAWQRGTERMWEVISALPAEMLEATPQLKEIKGPRDIFLNMVDRLTPLGREQTPEDIGRLAVFLTSEDTKNITGQSINVDGGVVMD